MRLSARGMVIVFDGRQIRHNNHAILEKGTPMSLVGLRTHILSNGDRFNILEKKVDVLPMDALSFKFLRRQESFFDTNFTNCINRCETIYAVISLKRIKLFA